MNDTRYPLNAEDRILRNKIEAVVISSYIVGLILSVVTKSPVCLLVTGISVPICCKFFK